ncbi:ABC transporter ATP-binding protein [Clostridiaceae bacterium M8S5]|nr:ABC transporter ATP-binding protein [Clostridiaceae bacterium M8S5]
MIEVKNFSKIYKLSKKQMAKLKTKDNIKRAANDISFFAERGKIYGLLGPNGAGKTTTLRCIATLLNPTEGHIYVDGHDSVKDSIEVRKKIGFLTNELKLDQHFTPNYTIEFFGGLHGMDKKTINKRKDELFEYFGITSFADKKIEDLSTGMKQKLSIAVSLIHDPDVVIFDEPTIGLDIITARAVLDYLKLLREKGKTVIISTHIMTLANKLCDNLGIIINGKIVANGTVKDILENTGTTDLEDAFFKLYKQNMN